MADASHDRDLLNAAAAFMAAAARRTPGPLNAEVKLAVERIAKEIKAIRAEVGGDNSLQGRVEALEEALADIAFNEKLLANGEVDVSDAAVFSNFDARRDAWRFNCHVDS